MQQKPNTIIDMRAQFVTPGKNVCNCVGWACEFIIIELWREIRIFLCTSSPAWWNRSQSPFSHYGRPIIWPSLVLWSLKSIIWSSLVVWSLILYVQDRFLAIRIHFFTSMSQEHTRARLEYILPRIRNVLKWRHAYVYIKGYKSFEAEMLRIISKCWGHF